ncbi:368_t:CDS:1 [Ambispora leptoticha]|uniref:368_t:CDS:1 n=1 Tax=Ambispora leptoticha TaxID=144679 RepID=A0A9N9D7L3_9GLOM|nr:368_t:CDS:1 [Ambispora leptoticha]
MGRQFYQNIHWNTMMFKLTIVGLILFNVLNLTTTVFLINDIIKQPRYIIWVVKMIAGALTTMLAFAYTFSPVIILHWNPKTPKLQKTGHINSLDAASATWYLVSLTCLSVLYLILYIMCLFNERTQQYLPLTTAIDSILRSIITFVLGSPPPKRFIDATRAFVINRRPLNGAIRDRGVLSTGMMGGDLYTDNT